MKSIIIILILSISSIIYGQIFESWVSRVNGGFTNSWDEGKIIKTDNYGNIYVAGITQTTQNFIHDCITMKYWNNNIPVWSQTYHEDNNGSVPESMSLDQQGNIIVTGSIGSSNNTLLNFLSIKYNPSGIQQWVRTADLASRDQIAYDIATDNQNNIYVVGLTVSNVNWTDDILLIKYNSAGQQLWYTVYDGGGYDEANRIVIDNSGYLYIIGARAIYGNYDLLILKYQTNYSSNNQPPVWVRTYDGTLHGDDGAVWGELDQSGSYLYVCGNTCAEEIPTDDGDETEPGPYAMMIQKYNSSGNLLATERYWAAATIKEEAIASMCKISNTGNVYITGHLKHSNTNRDIITIKYNSNLIRQWVKRYNGPGNMEDRGRALEVDQFEEIYITGQQKNQNSLDPRYMDYITLNYNKNGKMGWGIVYDNENLEDQAYSIALVKRSCVPDDFVPCYYYDAYVTGKSKSSVNNFDIVTIKYSPVLTPANDEGNNLINESISQVTMLDSLKYIAVGENGLIKVTHNSGRNWLRNSLNHTNNLRNILSVNQNTLLGIGDSNIIITSNNGGNSWHISYNSNLNGIKTICMNNSTLFGAGDNGKIIKSNNNGNTWTNIPSITTEDINCIKFKNGLGLAVGNNGLLIRTTNNGNSWTRINLNLINKLNGIEFLNNSKIIIIGDGGVILGSLNNGLSWQICNSGVNKNLNSVSFVNSNKGYAVGDSGTIIYTIDGGSSWIKMPRTITEKLTSCKFYSDKYGVVTGSNGTILITGIGESIISSGDKQAINNIQSNNKSIDNLELYQNYPNPFNPVTEISYKIPSETKVTLKIYDVLGKLVKILVDDIQETGTHKILFDASSLSSGIYYYTLHTNTFTQTKKMLLVK